MEPGHRRADKRSAGAYSGVWVKMSDPRNVAHDKKVSQQKQHNDEKAAVADERDRRNEAAGVQTADHAPGELEKSVAVLSKLKEMEFHSRANIETLAGMTLTIDDELKQKEFSDSVGALYSAQDGFQTQIAALVESYSAKCESLKPSV
jgi:hypothetical protein